LLSDMSVRHKTVHRVHELRGLLSVLTDNIGAGGNDCNGDGADTDANSGANADTKATEGAPVGEQVPSTSHLRDEGVQLKVEGARLLFASRTLELDKPLSLYVGTNEKSKVKLRLCTKATGDGVVGAVCGAVGEDRPSACAARSGNPATQHMQQVPTSVSDMPGACGGALACAVSDREISLSAFFRVNSGGSVTARGAASEQVAEAEEDEDELRLSEAQVAQLRDSMLVKLAMRSRRLRELVRHIDGSESRELALRRLEDALKDEEFNQFTEDVLAEIGHGNRAAELQ